MAEQNTISENLPPPTAAYKLKYQQYEAEMKEGYKQYSQRAAEKKANYNQSSESPRKTPEKQVVQYTYEILYWELLISLLKTLVPLVLVGGM